MSTRRVPSSVARLSPNLCGHAETGHEAAHGRADRETDGFEHVAQCRARRYHRAGVRVKGVRRGHPEWILAHVQPPHPTRMRRPDPLIMGDLLGQHGLADPARTFEGQRGQCHRRGANQRLDNFVSLGRPGHYRTRQRRHIKTARPRPSPFAWRRSSLLAQVVQRPLRETPR